MAREHWIAADADGSEHRFVLEVFQEGEHWTARLARLDDAGNLEDARIAPVFYGLTQEQARRKMLSVLENQYEDVRPG